MLSAEWKNVRNLLAIRPDNIGDVVMLGPSLRTLRQALPQARLTLLASPAGSRVAPLLPWLDEVITLKAVWQELSQAISQDGHHEFELVERLRSRNFDAAVIFTSFSQSPYPPAYVCYLAGIPLRLGQSKEFGGSLLTQWVKPLPDEVHQVDRNLFLLESAGFDRPRTDRHLTLAVPRQSQQAADTMLRDHGVDPDAPFIVLAPGASCAARRYDPVRYGLAARLLVRQTGFPIVVVGSRRETELVKPIVQGQNRGIVSLVGRTSVAELVGLIRRATLVIANNSGSIHIADAFRRPMVVLYSGTEYESQWQPRYAPTRLLRRPTDCSPCYSFRCPYQMECLDISPEEVATAAEMMLAVERLNLTMMSYLST